MKGSEMTLWGGAPDCNCAILNGILLYVRRGAISLFGVISVGMYDSREVHDRTRI